MSLPPATVSESTLSHGTVQRLNGIHQLGTLSSQRITKTQRLTYRNLIAKTHPKPALTIQLTRLSYQTFSIVNQPRSYSNPFPFPCQLSTPLHTAPRPNSLHHHYHRPTQTMPQNPHLPYIIPNQPAPSSKLTFHRPPTPNPPFSHLQKPIHSFQPEPPDLNILLLNPILNHGAKNPPNLPCHSLLQKPNNPSQPLPTRPTSNEPSTS